MAILLPLTGLDQAQLTPLFMEAIKHVSEEPLNDVQNLKVVLMDGHLKI